MLQRQKSGIIRRIKKLQTKMKPLIISERKEKIKLAQVKRDLTSLNGVVKETSKPKPTPKPAPKPTPKVKTKRKKRKIKIKKREYTPYFYTN